MLNEPNEFSCVKFSVGKVKEKQENEEEEENFA